MALRGRVPLGGGEKCRVALKTADIEIAAFTPTALLDRHGAAVELAGAIVVALLPVSASQGLDGGHGLDVLGAMDPLRPTGDFLGQHGRAVVVADLSV